MVADGLDENGITVNGYVLGCGDLYVLDNDTNLEPLVDKSYVKYCASTPSTPMRGDLVVVVENGNTIVKIYNGTEWKNQTLFTKTSDLVNDSGFITASAIPTNVTAFNNDAGYITVSAIPSDISAFQNDVGYITASALPTNISELENDVGYITSSAIPSNVGAFANDAGYITESAIPSSLGAFYNDVGYLTSVSWGEVLGKPSNLSDFNNDVGFITTSAIPQNVSSFVNDVGYITASALPSNVSELNNDSGFITASAVPSNVSEFNNDVGYLSAVSWNDIQNKPAIPSTTNDLTNNSGFITSSAIPSNVTAFNNDAGYITASQVPIPSFIQDEDENKIEADLSTHQKTSDFNWYVDGVKGSPDNSFYGASYTPSDPQYNGWVLHVTEGSSMPDAYDITVNWTSYVNGEWIEDSTMFQGLLPVGETEFTADGHTARMVYKYEDGKLATEDDLPTKTSDLTNDSGFITSAEVPTKTSDLTNDSGFITSDEVEPYHDALTPTVNTRLAKTAYTLALTDYTSFKPVDGGKVFASLRTNRDLTNQFRATMLLTTYWPYVMSMYNGQTLSPELSLYFCKDQLRYGSPRPRQYYDGYMFRTAGAGFAIPCSEDGTPDGRLIETTDVQGYYVLMANNTTSIHSIGFSADYNDIVTIDGQSDMIFAHRTNAYKMYSFSEEIANKSELPTKTSDLTNDSGFITLAQVPTPSYIEDATGNRINANLSCTYIDNAWEVTDPSSNKHILEYVGFIQSYHTWECVEPENIKLVLTYANDWELQVYTWQEIGPGGDHDWVLDINGSYNGDSDITTIPYFVNAQTTYNYSAQRPVTKHLTLATKEYVDSLFAQLNARISALENN